LEALRFAFEEGPKWIHLLPPLPEPGEPEARAKALARFKEYLSSFLKEFMDCHGSGKYFPVAVERAAHVLWNREMQYPRPSVEALIVQSIQPFTHYLTTCIKVLRPDLDPEALFRMSMSIHGQLIWMHNHAELTRLLRGKAYGPEDLDSLAEHFIQFSLRGLGLPGSLPPQGA
jgi:hypothetical protein